MAENRQTSLPAPTLRERPELAVEFVGQANATHSPYRPQKRVLCSCCVKMLYDTRGSWAPLAATWMRKRPAYNPKKPRLDEYAFLCQQHHVEWKERDTAAKEQAGKAARLR